ncbi:hypothetical protein MTO96_024405 [Rhipicephalus appendiculatus]
MSDLSLVSSIGDSQLSTVDASGDSLQTLALTGLRYKDSLAAYASSDNKAASDTTSEDAYNNFNDDDYNDDDYNDDDHNDDDHNDDDHNYDNHNDDDHNDDDHNDDDHNDDQDTVRYSSPKYELFSVDQLICTVSDTAVFPEMVPPDGLCHYVYYTNIAGIAKGDLIPFKNNLSWVSFTKALSSYKKTSGGIGFDVRYVMGKDFDAAAQANLSKLNSKNLKHYGILNAIESSINLKGIFNKAKDLLKTLKSFQANDKTRRTLLAFGIYNYFGKRAWDTLQQVFTSAINDAVADTVIAYSSVGWIERPSDCFSHPPSIFNKSKYSGEAAKEAGRAPDIFTVSRMMARNKRYNSGVKMGLSFELGTLVYHVKNAAVNLDMVNVACDRMYIERMDIVPCKVNVHLRNEPF